MTGLAWIAAFLAGTAGFLFARSVVRRHRQTRLRAALHHDGIERPSLDADRSNGERRGQVRTSKAALSAEIHCQSAFERSIVESMATLSLALAMGSKHSFLPLSEAKAKSLETLLAKAGLTGVVTSAGFFETRARWAVLAMGVGLIVGLVLSDILGITLAILGLIAGWVSPLRFIKGRIKRRADELEHHLPEALEVISLGLRSGLSFDRSLELYTGHFSTSLSAGLSLAQRQWTHGLLTREQALRSLADTYDSSLFKRVIENIIRSLRFGASMASSLESTAVEARQSYQAKKQEQVAKTPIKMMVPTGALILPAMLILVLGPVLLELMEGF